MATLYANNASTTLASGATAVATTLTVVDGSAFPSPSGSDGFWVTLESVGNVEIVWCSARSGNVLTVTRAQQSTTARAWNAGTLVENRWTAADPSSFATVDAGLVSLALVDASTGVFPYTTGAETWAGANLSAFGRSLVDDADASTARATLGLVIGTNVQPQSSILTGFASAFGFSTDGDIAVGDGAGGFYLVSSSVFAQGFLSVPSASAGRSSLGLVIGSDVQAYDTGLASLVTVDTAADLLPYTTAANTWAATTLTSFARTLLDDTDAATARATLGFAVDVQIFEADGTWTKPTGARRVHRYLVAGGGGGGGGARGAATNALSGGAGGAGGGADVGEEDADIYSATESVTIGVGGAGGPITNVIGGGPSGSDGTDTVFATHYARGGLGGAGGYRLSFGWRDGAYGGMGGGRGGGVNQTATSLPGIAGGPGGGGGGGGGSRNSSNVIFDAGNGGATSGATGGIGGTGDTAGTDGGDGSTAGPAFTGAGGGGGGCGILSSGYPGGAGGFGGGGGGGGGAGLAWTGAGGDGGDGFAIISTWIF